MSFFRPQFLDDLIKPLPSVSPRIRGLKGFDPQQLAAMQDPLFADDPSYWMTSGTLVGSPANLGHVGVQVSGASDIPSNDSLVVIVDGVLVSCSIAELFAVDVASPAVAEATDTAVFKRNRREMPRPSNVERAGILRVIDNLNANVGTTIAQIRGAAGTPVYIPLGFRIYGTEQLFVRNTSANVTIEATLWGRISQKGQR